MYNYNFTTKFFILLNHKVIECILGDIFAKICHAHDQKQFNNHKKVCLHSVYYADIVRPKKKFFFTVMFEICLFGIIGIIHLISPKSVV